MLRLSLEPRSTDVVSTNHAAPQKKMSAEKLHRALVSEPIIIRAQPRKSPTSGKLENLLGLRNKESPSEMDESEILINTLEGHSPSSKEKAGHKPSEKLGWGGGG